MYPNGIGSSGVATRISTRKTNNPYRSGNVSRSRSFSSSDLSAEREETTSRRLSRSNSVQLDNSAVVVQSNSQVEEEKKEEEEAQVVVRLEEEQKMADPGAVVSALLAGMNAFI